MNNRLAVLMPTMWAVLVTALIGASANQDLTDKPAVQDAVVNFGPRAGGQVNRPASRLVLAESVEQLGELELGEPMLVEHPSGVLFVSGFAFPTKTTLWKSADRGRSWSPVDAEKTAAGLLGNSDIDLAVAPDGTLYWVNMTFKLPREGGSRWRSAGTRERPGRGR